MTGTELFRQSDVPLQAGTPHTAATVTGRATSFDIRLHGRGGQGVVTAAELLAVAAFLEGRETQAFPTFGSERMGAPVTSFCRISRDPISVREPVTAPNAIVILDATLLHHVDVFAGLEDDGWVLINSSRSVRQLGLDGLVERSRGRVICVPATDIARVQLGRPLPNVCLLGAFAAQTGAVSLRSLEAAVRERFPAALAEQNIRAARAAAAQASEVRDA